VRFGSGRREVLGRVAALAAGILAGACGGSLVDHSAGADVLYPSGCPAGQVLCGAACVPEDALHCGSSCASCASEVPPAPNAGPVCTEAHACTFACAPGFLRVDAACERAQAVSGGFAHTCAITASGRVKCWGANEHGQLGDGTTEDRPLPVDVVGLPGPATAIAAGYVHTCAVVAGAPWCWGDNTTGALGDGTTSQRSAPARVSGLSGATALSAGGGENAGPSGPTYYGHTCAVVGAGSIQCWGSNESGQLGNGTFAQSATPVAVALGNLEGQATAVSNGDRHTCAVVAGGVRCWGAASSGQLGSGTTTNQATPQSVSLQPSGVTATAIAAGAAHGCAAVGPTAALECWGSNARGQVAGGATGGDVPRPATVSLPAGFAPTGAAAGNAHTCAVDGTSGAVACFGANDASQLSGAPTATGLVAVPLPSGAKAIAAGFAHSCALVRDDGIVCWGANARGQLGSGAASASSGAPAFVSGR
jgi:alpha-tubulin suppressor-like RCC1 family protein